MQNTTYNIFKTHAQACEKVLMFNIPLGRKFSFIVDKSYNKTIIDFNFGRHKDLSTLKKGYLSQHSGLGEYHFWGS